MDDSNGLGCSVIALFVLIAIFAAWAVLEPVDISNGAVVTVAEPELEALEALRTHDGNAVLKEDFDLWLHGLQADLHYRSRTGRW